jgi:ZIP family zinc transporter
MSLIFDVLVYATLPAGGVIIGSLLAESIRTPKWLIGASLHATAGVTIALVSVNIMPRVLGITPMWLIVVSFLVGAGISALIASFWGTYRHRPNTGSIGAWMVCVAVATDLVCDGLMVGAGTAIGAQLGILFAATQSIANIPGGFAATANLRDDGLPKALRLGLSAFMLAPALVSAAVGYYVLRDASTLVHNAVLAAFAGILLLATVEDVIPQGDEPDPPRRISTAAFALGFAGLALLSSILE